MKKNIFTILLFCTFLCKSNPYVSAGGLKFNHYKLALNYKIFLSDSTNSALDLEFGFQQYGVEFIGLHNWQRAIPGVKSMHYYYGIGFNAGLWDGPVRDINIGIDGQIGVEFVPDQIPVVFSLDYTPNFSLKNSYSKYFDSHTWGSGPWLENWTFGVKYRFGGSAKK